jgi:UDP-N-acetylmuramate--alanine ligase
MKNFNQFYSKHIHFIGIGGISMSGLAQIVIHNGGIVTGSDISVNQETEKLSRLGATIYLEHNRDNITDDIALVVHTSAVGEDNPEMHKARELDIPIMERAEFLGLVAREYDKVIAIAGTHGKTTTTAMIAEIFENAGLHPTIHLGGESIGLGGNTIIGENKYLIVEACEYKESFRFLRPYLGIITNIETDHLDYYKDYADIRTAFLRFASNSRHLISLDSDNISHEHIETVYGDWKASHIHFMGDGYNFNVFYKGKFWNTFRLNMLGEHNIFNALFAIATAHFCGIKKSVIEEALSGFKGVERRYECIHTYNSGCRVIIDYAHHPTELDASIKGLQGVYSSVLYVFQPHTYSRTIGLFNEFTGILRGLPNIVMFATYPAREKLIAGGTAMDLYLALNTQNKKYFDNTEDLLHFFDDKCTEYDCILVLGAGNLAENLKNKYNNG